MSRFVKRELTYEIAKYLEIRLIARVFKTRNCWNWTGALSSGYGVTSYKKQSFYVHRISMVLHTGMTLPNDKVIDHLCRNTSCFNPNHLELTTMKVNTLRGASAGAYNARKTHCLLGHPLSEKNLKILKDGSRKCRKCDVKRGQEYRKRKNALL